MKATTGNDKVSGCRYFSANFKKKGKKLDRRIRRHKAKIALDKPTTICYTTPND